MADHSGQTPLHMAVTREEKAIEVLLLSYGATKPADLNPLSIELLESNFGTT
ncbi:hypothetical protein BJY01DRAFT_221635 [Aspergillus pseudoustus]|uniref:Ankyrin repeat-containing domain protein n=1 Tax=Aspergillus pseudoustus TaxID=1810923 RepID=A0ABR4JCB4_9EURO